MNTLELERCISADPVLCVQCMGVFPRNKIAAVEAYPCSLVVNLDSNKEKGSHWVCIYFDNIGRAEYFCSYGREPEHQDILQFLKKYSTSQPIWNTKCLQNIIATTCGQWCLYFLHFRHRHKTMEAIVKQFSCDYARNDAFVVKFINKYYGTATHVFDVGIFE